MYCFNRPVQPIEELVQEGAEGSISVKDLLCKLPVPRVVWLMIPAAAVDSTVAELIPHLAPGDILIDGGNSYYIDDIRRSKEFTGKGIHYIDVGTSGGVWGSNAAIA